MWDTLALGRLQYVKTSMGANFFFRFNKESKTAEDIFTESHAGLFRDAVEWVSMTSQTCSLVATFIATVSFSTVTTIPGGIKEGSGSPVLADQPAFDVYAVSSLFALCFSMTSMFIFLSILLSHYEQKDFAIELPWKLLLGLTSLFVSTVSMMVSFCAGHFFMLKYKLGSVALSVYAMTCLPVAYFVVTKFPLYISLISGNFNKVPVQSTDTDPL